MKRTSIAILILFLTGSAFADDRSFVTADGAMAPMPEIDGLTCLDIQSVLDAIDATGYRGISPGPLNQIDMPLFEYEMQLSEWNYRRCALAPALAEGGDPLQTPTVRSFKP